MAPGLMRQLVSKDEGQGILVWADPIQEPERNDDDPLLIALGDNLGGGNHIEGKTDPGNGAGDPDQLRKDGPGSQDSGVLVRQRAIMGALKLEGSLCCAER